jgi:hypothetical protein
MNSIKNIPMYEALKRKGFPKENAAKISNAAVGRRLKGKG